MGDARLDAGASRERVRGTLSDARRRATGLTPRNGGAALLALQRHAGNAAVSALVAAKLRSPGETAESDMDSALRELRGDKPAVDTVEKGLKAAQAAGIPVDLEGTKPPPSALAVRLTGFGPEAVPAKKPVPPAKPVPPKSPLATAAKVAPKGAVKPAARPPGPAAGSTGQAAGPASAAGLAGAAGGAKLLQPPAPPTRVRPEEDPAFNRVTGTVREVGKGMKAHPPAASKAAESQGAAVAPSDDREAQAKAAKADTMDAQQPGSFDKKTFIAAVKAAIEAKSPKTLKEADDYQDSGKAGEVKGDVAGLVSQGKEGQTKDIATATEAAPDESKAVPKEVTPLQPEEAPSTPRVAGEGAVPKPAPPEQLNLAAGKHQADQELAQEEVTEPQLEQSGETDFQQAVVDKRTAAAHADTAPGEFRQHEQQVIEQKKGEVTGEAQAGVAGMRGAKGAALAGVVADKAKTKSKDEARRAEVTAKIQGIFAATEAEVKKLLDGIDPKVEAAFDKGEAQARAEFESYVDAKMTAYKKDRYGGWLGGFRWAKDKLLGMPSKVNEFYEAGRELYLKRMDKVISQVADIVGNDLTAAKRRIAQGRSEIADYVKSLPRDLQKVGSEASAEIGERFSALEEDVQSKQDSVVDTLASKYVEARKGLDERIEALQAENKGLVDKAIGAIKAVINTIRELAAMLRNVLSRVAGVVGQIIKNPVAFLGNLIEGIKGGILRFKDNFVEHLRKGLMGWLFGALAESGIELPESFDVKGVIKLLASLFGLTWRNIRNRIVKQIGEKAMGVVEGGVSIFQTLAGQGVGGLWEMLLEKLGDIKEMILDQVKDFVVTKVITAGITWLIGLLNPAAAFIKACKLIYDVVMFFVNNASRIADFVNTVIDSVADVVRGNVSGVAAKIENVLGKMVPIIIGFLASLIGLGGIGEKVRTIVETLQKPFTKAIDAVVKGGLKLAAPLIRGVKGIGAKVKAKVAAGKAYVKGKVEAGRQYVRGKAMAAAERLGIIRRPVPLPERQKTLSADMRTGAVVLRTASDAAPDPASRTAINAEEEAIRHLTRTGTAARGPIANHLKTIGDMLVRAHRRIGPASAPPGVVTPTGPLNADQQQTQQALNNPVRRHGDNSGLVPREPKPRTLWLESEHVVPVSWVSIALRLLGQRAINRRGGFQDVADDKSMTTVLTYEQASRRKTREEGPIFNALESILEEEMPRRLQERSQSRAALELRGRTTRAQRDAMRESWEARVGRLRTRLFDALHGQLSASVDRTERVVIADHSANKHAVRGHVAPLPQSAHIRTAATRQIEDMARILSERVEHMFPAESALAEVTQDETVREELRRREREPRGGPPAGYKQLPSGLLVPVGTADE